MEPVAVGAQGRFDLSRLLELQHNKHSNFSTTSSGAAAGPCPWSASNALPANASPDEVADGLAAALVIPTGTGETNRRDLVPFAIQRGGSRF